MKNIFKSLEARWPQSGEGSRENVARTGVSGRKPVMPKDRVLRLLIAAWAAKRGPSKWRSLVRDQELRQTHTELVWERSMGSINKLL